MALSLIKKSPMKHILLITLLGILSCKQPTPQSIELKDSYDEAAELQANSDHQNPRMRYKLIESKVLDKKNIWNTIDSQLDDFSQEEYTKLKPFIFEQDILTIQGHIKDGKLTYKKLTQWYLYRIRMYEKDRTTTLHSIISINPKAVQQASIKDKNKTPNQHPIYGMPILLKDNINTLDMPTTAGAIALEKNQTNDAFIVDRIKENGGIILGKANLSEWAYFFCSGCPLGYSAIGGQTLNPYGRKIYETGGSSAGSGTTMAANYAAAAVGTETSGSILSPSSQNSIVGLKPTIGLLSRAGIVPISSTLDTPGPMTRSVSDNAILLSAMSGEDNDDSATRGNPKDIAYWKNLNNDYLKGKRLGVNKNFLEDTLYNIAVTTLKEAGAQMIEFTPEDISFDQFVTFLNADMKKDLPQYLSHYTGEKITVRSVVDVVEFNTQDTLIRAPYGQALFQGIVEEKISEEEFDTLKKEYDAAGKSYFDIPMKEHNLDAILSINNYNAGHAAMAKYPCLTVPMGYEGNGEPKSLTFIAKTYEEHKLLKLGYAYEQVSHNRKPPAEYNN